MKKILIVGAGFLQSFVIKKAKELGYYTYAIDKNPNATGFDYADDYKILDIIDEKACLDYAKSKEIDGVMTAATDYGVLTAAYIANIMNLPGLNYEVAKKIKNKYAVRHILSANNIDDISQHFEVDNLDEVNAIKEKIDYPIMVKPCDGSGSKAAQRINSETELKKACKEAIEKSIIGKALLEDFIEGKEYGVESFVYDDKINVLGIMGKHMTPPPNYAELGHYMPSDLIMNEKIEKVVKSAIEFLGIEFGPVNMDILITREENVCIIDVGARMGGNLIGSHIIPISTNLDYMAAIIQASVGDLKDFDFKIPEVNVATRLLALDSGIVKKLPDFKKIKDKYNIDIYHQLKIGEEINEYKNNLDGKGYIVSTAETIKEAEHQAEQAKIMVNEGIIRE